MEAPRAGAGANREAGRSVAWIVAGVGGVLAVVGCRLAWLKITLGSFAILITVPRKTLAPDAWGVDTFGKVATIAAILLLVCAVILAVSGSNRLRSIVGLLAVIAGALVAFIAVFEVLSKGARVDHLLRSSFSASVHRPLSDAQFDRIKALLDRLGFAVSAGVGMYLSIVGGVLGLVGGILAAGTSGPHRPAVAQGTGGFLEPHAATPSPLVPPAPAIDPQPATATEPTHQLPAPGGDGWVLDPPPTAGIAPEAPAEPGPQTT